MVVGGRKREEEEGRRRKKKEKREKEEKNFHKTTGTGIEPESVWDLRPEEQRGIQETACRQMNAVG